ncbi:MAG: hypothetical protein HYW69_03275 [Candidatus Nealsonbacteria bacterium]|nr:hypothetical protein [Candidatus Nealsonbacteria bacterium]
MQSYLTLIIPVVTAFTAQIFFKKGISSIKNLDFSPAKIFFLVPQILKNIWLASGILIFGISFLSYIFALSQFQLSVVYPILVSAGIILISLASKFMFKESLGFFKIAGIIFIISGIFLLAS